MRKLLLKLTQTKFWYIIIMRIIPYLRFSMYYTRFSGMAFNQGLKHLQPGRFLLTMDEKKATTVLVPGFMTHAAYCVNNCVARSNSSFEIVEMTHEDFAKNYFFDVCKEASRVLICDCDDWDYDHKARMVSAVPRLSKAKYDVGFSLGIKALYCSELVYQLDRIASNPGATDSDLSDTLLTGSLRVDLSDIAGLKKPYISPDGLLFAKNIRVIWDSDGILTGMTGPQAEKFLSDAKLV